MCVRALLKRLRKLSSACGTEGGRARSVLAYRVVEGAWHALEVAKCNAMRCASFKGQRPGMLRANDDAGALCTQADERVTGRHGVYKLRHEALSQKMTHVSNIHAKTVDWLIDGGCRDRPSSLMGFKGDSQLPRAQTSVSRRSVDGMCNAVARNLHRDASTCCRAKESRKVRARHSAGVVDASTDVWCVRARRSGAVVTRR